MSLIELKDVWKIYSLGEVEVPALQGINLKIDKGDFIAILGASGSGKSTMMNIIGCLDRPTKGNLILEGKDVSEMGERELASYRGRKIGFIFQEYNLIERMTVLENIMLPLYFLEIDDDIAEQKAIKVIRKVGLSDKRDSLPTQLSGGQRQRVSIARSLVANPEIILADEPTGALDSKTGHDIINSLVDLWKDGKTIVMITHDIELAKNAHTIITLMDGKIIQNKENK